MTRKGQFLADRNQRLGLGQSQLPVQKIPGSRLKVVEASSGAVLSTDLDGTGRRFTHMVKVILIHSADAMSAQIHHVGNRMMAPIP